MDSFLNLSEELKQGIQIAQKIAKEFYNGKYSVSYLLKALLTKGSSLFEFPDRMTKDVNYIRECIEARIENYPGNEKIEGLIDESDTLRIKMFRNAIEPVCFLAALCKPNIAFLTYQLKSLLSLI